MKECSSGKKKYDKKGAVSFGNLTMRLHHIKMKPYACPECRTWHLSTDGEHRRFRRDAFQKKRRH